MINRTLVASKNSVNGFLRSIHDLGNCALISIRDSDRNKALIFEYPNLKDTLFTQFDDILVGEERYHFDTNFPMIEINKGQAEEIVDFIIKNKDLDTMICQCEAGISRSAAIAAAIQKIFCLNEKTDYFNSFRYNPNKDVNKLVIRSFKEKMVEKLRFCSLNFTEILNSKNITKIEEQYGNRYPWNPNDEKWIQEVKEYVDFYFGKKILI